MPAPIAKAPRRVQVAKDNQEKEVKSEPKTGGKRETLTLPAPEFIPQRNVKLRREGAAAGFEEDALLGWGNTAANMGLDYFVAPEGVGEQEVLLSLSLPSSASPAIASISLILSSDHGT